MSAHHHFTDEEIQWLIDQDKSLTYAELTDMFNSRFGTKLKRHSISDLMCKRLKRISRLDNRCNTQFKKGAKPKYEVGAEIIKAGYVYVKTDDHYFEGQHSPEQYKHNWKRKSDLVWEQHHGEIPDGWFVVFLNGNPLDCSIDNLAIVNRSIHARMNQNHWYSDNKDITRLGLKWCELLLAIQGVKENENRNLILQSE